MVNVLAEDSKSVETETTTIPGSKGKMVVARTFDLDRVTINDHDGQRATAQAVEGTPWRLSSLQRITWKLMRGSCQCRRLNRRHVRGRCSRCAAGGDVEQMGE